MKKEQLSLIKFKALAAASLTLIQLFIGDSLKGFNTFLTVGTLDSLAKFGLFILVSAFLGILVASILSRFKNKFYVRILTFSFLLLFSSGIYIYLLIATNI
jgi:hypothetical protein